MMRFDRFTERAQEAAQRAAEIIQRYGHNQIDTEHILLALIEQPQGVIPQILEKLNIDLDGLSDRIDQMLRASPKANNSPAPNSNVVHRSAPSSRRWCSPEPAPGELPLSAGWQ